MKFGHPKKLKQVPFYSDPKFYNGFPQPLVAFDEFKEDWLKASVYIQMQALPLPLPGANAIGLDGDVFLRRY
ncbi:MAG: hypothetical protein ACI82Z_000380 [Cellvibrionaceae bacterium]|jgi:hypothetical protein